MWLGEFWHEERESTLDKISGCTRALAAKFRNSGNRGFSSASFPLTPALSLRERETPNSAVEKRRSSGLSKDWKTILPLPEGEGRGEGEAVEQFHTASDESKLDCRRTSGGAADSS